MRNWKNLGETAVVAWFREQYLSPMWKLWHYPASMSPGLTPNQNHLTISYQVQAKRYLQSRKGHLSTTDGVEHIEKNYLSLYLVQQLSDESFEHNWSSLK